MNFDHVLTIFRDTYAGEWHRVDTRPPLGENAHYLRIVYKPDVALAVEWGSTVNDTFAEDWTERFVAGPASSHLAEITYNGVVVYQQSYVLVDGGRCELPLPKKHFKEQDILERPEIDHYSVTTWEVGFMRLLNELAGNELFDDYLRRTGFQVV
jgi:hypothetical protein